MLIMRANTLCTQQLRDEVEQYRKQRESEAEAKEQTEFLAAGVKSLEEALKRRSTTSMVEGHKELVIGLNRFKASLEGTVGDSVSSISLQRMYVDKTERLCHGAITEAEKFMDETGLGRLLDPLKVVLERMSELVQLMEGFELEPSKAEIMEISQAICNERKKAQKIAQPLLRSENSMVANKTFMTMQREPLLRAGRGSASYSRG